jgi:S1-C subfamily serine protease
VAGAAAACVLFAFAAACSTQSNTPAATLSAAVRIEADGCRNRPTVGAGSFVAPNRVLTVAHVVAGSTEVDVTVADGSEVEATVVAIDRTKDLALLAVDADNQPLRVGSLRPGENGEFVVWRDDAAQVRKFTAISFVDINASNIDHDGSGLRKGFQIDADVSNGDSGSVLVHDGAAVAVVFARSTAAGGRAWATDIREASPMLRPGHDDPVDVGECAAG